MNFASLINPKIGLSLIKNELEKQVRQRPNDLLFFGLTANTFKIDSYDMIYVADTNSISFDVVANDRKRRFPYLEGEKIAKLLAAGAKEKMPPNSSLDVLILKSVNEDKILAYLYITTLDNEKQLITYDI